MAEARERGQTAFLSSHQLAEVEAVCDRVGILSAGRLVEIAGLTESRRLHRTSVEIGYRGAEPSLVDVPGRRVVRTELLSTGLGALVLRAVAG
ncbi:hypothetical protein [Amycolatopsis keratiniphila]|uniref:hypothetical protein n=1 Tax=Amycolatopsis keratiniphila TaxID=129921 RepID=UPI003F4D6B0D